MFPKFAKPQSFIHVWFEVWWVLQRRERRTKGNTLLLYSAGDLLSALLEYGTLRVICLQMALKQPGLTMMLPAHRCMREHLPGTWALVVEVALAPTRLPCRAMANWYSFTPPTTGQVLSAHSGFVCPKMASSWMLPSKLGYAALAVLMWAYHQRHQQAPSGDTSCVPVANCCPFHKRSFTVCRVPGPVLNTGRMATHSLLAQRACAVREQRSTVFQNKTNWATLEGGTRCYQARKGCTEVQPGRGIQEDFSKQKCSKGRSQDEPGGRRQWVQGIL